MAKFALVDENDVPISDVRYDSEQAAYAAAKPAKPWLKAPRMPNGKVMMIGMTVWIREEA